MQKLCFASKVEVLPPRHSKCPRAAPLHAAVANFGVGANAVPALISILCAQTAYYFYCVQTLIANVFVAFAAKLQFICILSMVPVSAHSVGTDSLLC